MSRIRRREFLRSSAYAAGISFVVSGTKASGRVLGANDAIRVGIAGLNGRGGAHVSELISQKDAVITYVIDPDRRVWAAASEKIEKASGRRPTAVQDVRKALEDKELDAISIATPNHWHALMTIWACEAGKDVYVEKPCSHNVHEGRIAVAAARKFGRIVQHGTQSRSSGSWAQVADVIRSGKLGKLKVARGLCYKPRGSIGTKATGTAPADLDFNIWLGPATEQPFHGNLVHYNWHWFWDFGNGDIGNQGVHQMDIARWGIPGATLPQSVISFGGRFGYKDQGQTPNTQISVMDFGATLLIFEVRGLKTVDLKGEKVGNIFHLEEGDIVGTSFFPKGSDKAAPLPKGDASRGPGNGPFGNWLAAIRTRKHSDLNADILDGHYSSALGHLANISYRLGENAPFTPRSSDATGQADLAETIGRMEEHLGGGNGLDLKKEVLRVGRRIKIDAAKEAIVGDAEAAKLLAREYRKPFVVPERIAAS